MADIFGRNNVSLDDKNNMSSDAVSMAFSSEKGDNDSTYQNNNFILQQLQINYSQQVTRMYGLNNPSQAFFVSGRVDGQMTMQNILGPASLMNDFVASYGSVCKMKAGRNFLIQPDVGCVGVTKAAGKGTASLYVYNPIITQVGYQMSANDFILYNTIQATFTHLSNTKQADAAA